MLLAVRRVVCTLASRRLSAARIIGSTREDSTGAELFSGFVVAVFVTGLFFSGAGLLAQHPTPKPRGPVGLVSEFSSVFQGSVNRSLYLISIG